MASGMAAIATALQTFVGAGDSLLIQGSVYGGTFDLVHNDLPTRGITPIVVDPSDPGSWEAQLAPSTKVGPGGRGRLASLRRHYQPGEPPASIHATTAHPAAAGLLRGGAQQPAAAGAGPAGRGGLLPPPWPRVHHRQHFPRADQLQAAAARLRRRAAQVRGLARCWPRRTACLQPPAARAHAKAADTRAPPPHDLPPLQRHQVPQRPLGPDRRRAGGLPGSGVQGGAALLPCFHGSSAQLLPAAFRRVVCT
jgi:hypothetical protein